ELRLHRKPLILLSVVSPSVVPGQQPLWFDDDRDPVRFLLRILKPPLPSSLPYFVDILLRSSHLSFSTTLASPSTTIALYGLSFVAILMATRPFLDNAFPFTRESLVVR